MSKFHWKPVRSLKECDDIITAPGQFHELEHAIIDGALHRVYKNLWPSVREFWLSVVTNQPKIQSREYIVYRDERMTFLQADALVQRTASIFYEVYGIRKGDRVGIAIRNYPEFIISFFAAGLLGAVAVMLNAWLPAEPLVYCIKLTSPKLLIIDSGRLELLHSHLPELHLPTVSVRPSPSSNSSLKNVQKWSTMLSCYSGSVKAWQKAPDPHPEDNATIFFTSGTTALPKAVLSTQRSFLGNFFDTLHAQRRRELRIGQDLPSPYGAGPPTAKQTNTLIAVPLFHGMGCTGQLIIGTGLGSKIVLMYKWDKEEAARLIVNENIHSITGVPGIAYDIMDSKFIEKPVLNAIAVGGAPVPDTLANEFVQKFPNAIVQQGYGTTETNSLSASVFGEDYLARPDSIGLPLATNDIIIVDPVTNKVLPPGELGELWIRGANVMRGYWNDPEATAKALTRDGWYKSGDMGTMDKEGFFYIKDRLKDIIIRGGENIASTVVENGLFADERILDCAAVGIPDKRMGELVGAVVVPRKLWIGKVSEDDILHRVQERVPGFAIPSMILIQSETLDRNATGKTLKTALRKRVKEEWERRKKSSVNGKL